jgi:hypothetical protein
VDDGKRRSIERSLALVSIPTGTNGPFVGFSFLLFFSQF